LAGFGERVAVDRFGFAEFLLDYRFGFSKDGLRSQRAAFFQR